MHGHKTSHLPIRYFLALLWAHRILHISTIRVNLFLYFPSFSALCFVFVTSLVAALFLQYTILFHSVSFCSTQFCFTQSVSAVHNSASLSFCSTQFCFTQSVKQQRCVQQTLSKRTPELSPHSVFMCWLLFPHVPCDYQMFLTIPACSVWLSHVPYDYRMFRMIIACSIRLSHVPYDYRMFHMIIACSIWLSPIIYTYDSCTINTVLTTNSDYSPKQYQLLRLCNWGPAVGDTGNKFLNVIYIFTDG
jgi:hypothetical protein